jgi:hypothetical protein
MYQIQDEKQYLDACSQLCTDIKTFTPDESFGKSSDNSLWQWRIHDSALVQKNNGQFEENEFGDLIFED